MNIMKEKKKKHRDFEWKAWFSKADRQLVAKGR